MKNNPKEVEVIEFPMRKGRRIPPTPVNLKAYIEHAEGIQKQLDRHCNELGERVRKEVVLPICKKHKVTYTAGNGTFFFTKQVWHRGVIHNPLNDIHFAMDIDFDFDAEEEYHGFSAATLAKMKADLLPILDMLNHYIYAMLPIGYLVGDVKKEDCKS